MSERKRRGPITLLCENRRFRWTIIAAVLVPVLYVGSFGPACWIMSRSTASNDVPKAYLPMGWLIYNSPKWVENLLRAYARLGIPEGRAVLVPMGTRSYLGIR